MCVCVCVCVSVVKGDYCKMKYPDNSFDGLYALESTVYAKKPVDVYREVSVRVRVCVCE